jgi:hypothetical protein
LLTTTNDLPREKLRWGERGRSNKCDHVHVFAKQLGDLAAGGDRGDHHTTKEPKKKDMKICEKGCKNVTM